MCTRLGCAHPENERWITKTFDDILRRYVLDQEDQRRQEGMTLQHAKDLDKRMCDKEGTKRRIHDNDEQFTSRLYVSTELLSS
jgi:hypothetical protein